MKVNYFWKKHGMGEGTKNLEQKSTYNTYLKKKSRGILVNASHLQKKRKISLTIDVSLLYLDRHA